MVLSIPFTRLNQKEGDKILYNNFSYMIGLHNNYYTYLQNHLEIYKMITFMDLIEWGDYYNWIYFLNKDMFIWSKIFILKRRQMNKRR